MMLAVGKAAVTAGVPLVFVTGDAICGAVTGGVCGADTVHPAENTAVMIRKIVIIPIREIFTVKSPHLLKPSGIRPFFDG